MHKDGVGGGGTFMWSQTDSLSATGMLRSPEGIHGLRDDGAGGVIIDFL